MNYVKEHHYTLSRNFAKKACITANTFGHNCTMKYSLPLWTVATEKCMTHFTKSVKSKVLTCHKQ